MCPPTAKDVKAVAIAAKVGENTESNLIVTLLSTANRRVH